HNHNHNHHIAREPNSQARVSLLLLNSRVKPTTYMQQPPMPYMQQLPMPYMQQPPYQVPIY
ncbi:hypothetical protein DVH24_007893, partial [Malus domestica]